MSAIRNRSGAGYNRNDLFGFRYPTFASAGLPQCNAVTHEAHSARDVSTAPLVIDVITVANIETVLAAVSPNRVLDEPRKALRKSRIELPNIDALSGGLNNFGAAARPVASRAIAVLRLEPVQDAGAMQEIVNQRVDGDHAAADLDPQVHALRSTDQEGGQGHGEHLVRYAVDLA